MALGLSWTGRIKMRGIRCSDYVMWLITKFRQDYLAALDPCCFENLRRGCGFRRSVQFNKYWKEIKAFVTMMLSTNFSFQWLLLILTWGVHSILSFCFSGGIHATPKVKYKCKLWAEMKDQVEDKQTLWGRGQRSPTEGSGPCCFISWDIWFTSITQVYKSKPNEHIASRSLSM